VDTGKSTFCTYLANTALKLGIISCIIDGDIGQGDIVPPSAIGSTIINQAVTDLRDATATHFGFVGSISPAGIESLIIKTTHRLSESSCCGQARLQIINTDGYIDNGGLHYKRQMADEIQPDIVVMLGRNRLLANAIGSGDWTFLRTRSSTQANKSWTDRRWRRHDQFLRFVGDGQIFANTDEKMFRYLGNPIHLSDILSLLLIDPLWLKDVFVGLGRNEVIAGFGLIKNIDKNHVELRSDLREFDTIHLTNIRIGADMAEQITLEIPDQVPREN
jgi:polynucleotide 5'-hydroxyl-kinase GRC3/NOL9